MSIQSEINRISGNVANALTAIANKGVTIPAGSNSDDLATLIGQIQQGGGGTGAISIVDTPDAAGGTVRTITAVDISDTTAVAADVAQGKYFYTSAGVKTAGTASGGGSAVTVVETPDTGGGVVKNIVAVDISSDTVTAAHLESGYTAHDAAGNAITGTLSPSTTRAPQKQVNFIDYDGTILYSYTAQEANALSALPANPSHSGLTAQGWNWTLQEIKAQLTAMPDAPVWVGQMYITQSGDTEIDVRMPEGRLSPILTIAVNGEITVDWGDNTSADTVTGSSLNTQQAPSHTYAAPGEYTIKIHVVSGSFTFYGSSSYLLLRKNTTANQNRVYATCVHAIRIGSGITKIDTYAFYYCTSLAYITIPTTVTSIGGYAFRYCYSLMSVIIPSSVTSILIYTFSACYGLAFIAMPYAVTSIGNYAFESCHCLTSITIPGSVTTITAYAFNPCNGLTSITIPSNVTDIGQYAFSSCYGMKEYHIKPTSVPTLGASAFNAIVSDCVIYVPSAKLNDYQTAENWSAYASYMQGE